jgi:hypothetical protein
MNRKEKLMLTVHNQRVNGTNGYKEAPLAEEVVAAAFAYTL